MDRQLGSFDALLVGKVDALEVCVTRVVELIFDEEPITGRVPEVDFGGDVRFVAENGLFEAVGEVLFELLFDAPPLGEVFGLPPPAAFF